MSPSPIRSLLALLALLALGTGLPAATLTVAVDRPGTDIDPAMWGVFFEDINFGADGGIYAEMVKNRGFEFPDALMGWAKVIPPKARGTVSVQNDGPFNAKNPHYVRLESEGTAPVGVLNEGFRSMGVRAGGGYDFSARVRVPRGTPTLKVNLYGEHGALLASAELKGFSGDWQKRAITLTPNETDAKARLAVLMEGDGTLDLDFVSLFPQQTWKNRPGGLRADMVQALADLKPGFLRFPGGCIVEGTTLANRYQWKNTLGPIEERPLLINRWNHEFTHRATPDYYQSFGLGFFEYFVLCEDLGAAPMPILNCGMACQFNTGELCPMDELDAYIQDAIDLIEFANGPVTSPWGAQRAALGHPEPFNLKMIGVGNEQWGPQYVERFARFAEVLRAKHPEIALIGAAGPSPDDERFHFLWPEMRRHKADFVDEHSYARPEWFLDNAKRYDGYDRNGPRVLMGEYAAHSLRSGDPVKRSTFRSAIAEAAFMTGMERNADIVRMSAFAPLFGHVDAWQWAPNLIWVDNLRLARTASYHVQSLFSRNRGDRVLPVTLGDLSGDEERRLYASAVLDERAGAVIVKLVNATERSVRTRVTLAGVRGLKGGTRTVLEADHLDMANTLDHPNRIVPRETAVAVSGPELDVGLPSQSVTMLRLEMTR
jgi:alpha-L-arabinofuranosidase